MSTVTIRWKCNVGGMLTDPTSTPKLSDSAGAFGVKNTSTSSVITAADSAMTKESTGVYTYELTLASSETTDTVKYETQYTYAVEWVYGGETFHNEYTFTTPAESSPGRGTAAWACDAVEEYIGGTVAAGTALKYVQAGYDDFLRGFDPRTQQQHVWSFLNTYQELTLLASVEGTASGVYTASAVNRQLGTIAVTATTSIFTSSHIGMYLEVEDVGTYRITAYSSTTEVTVQVLTGQTAADFTSKSVRLAGMYDLASDFGGLNGAVTYMYSDAYYSPRLQQVTPAQMYKMWRDDEDAGVPRYYAIIPKEFASATGQRWQMLVYPRPENTRVVRIPYRVQPTALTDSSSVYFLGGDAHYETIKLAALANCELMTGRTHGVMKAEYEQAKAQSIDVDKRLYESYGPISTATEDTGLGSW